MKRFSLRTVFCTLCLLTFVPFVGLAQQDDAGSSAPSVQNSATSAGNNSELTAEESAALSSGLRWSPPTAGLSLDQPAETVLLDGEGAELARIRVSWDELAPPEIRDGKPYGLSIAHFTVEIQNLSTCTLSTLAKIAVEGNKFANVVTHIDWQEWTSEHHPTPGNSAKVQGQVGFGRNDRQLEIVPGDASSTLSGCRTSRP